MDWKSLTAKLDPLTAKIDPFLEKAKSAGYKALDFTQRQLQNTPVVLKSMEDFRLLRTSKRFILIGYDETNPISREILLRAPVWSTKAWSDAAEIRFIEITKSPELVRTIGIQSPVDMYVWYTGIETFHSSDVEAIKNWWKTRCYDGKLEPYEMSSSRNEKKSENKTENPLQDTIEDPLKGK